MTDAPESAHRWRVRWVMTDGMYTQNQIYRVSSKFTRTEVEAWAQKQVDDNPLYLARVDSCKPVLEGRGDES